MGDPAGIYHQNSLSIRKIGIRNKKVPVLDPPTEPIIGAENQPDLTIGTGVVHASQAVKMPVMQEFVTGTDLYNTGANRTPWRVSRTGIDGATPDTSSSRIITVDSCTSPTPPSG